MNLTDLPVDILLLLPPHIYNIEDFTNFSSSCRLLRLLYAETSPKLLLQLAAASTSSFFSPRPHFLVAATARQLGEWAQQSDENAQELEASFREGIDGVHQLCIEHASLTVERIRELHVARSRIVKPLVDLIKLPIMHDWSTPLNFLTQQVRDTTMSELHPASVRAAYQLIILGELFSHSVTAILDSSSPPPRITLLKRMEFIKYCIPDGSCLATRGGPVVDRVGPYATDNLPRLSWDQRNLDAVMISSIWDKFRTPDLLLDRHSFNKPSHDNLWMKALLCQGFDTAELLTKTDSLSSPAVERLRNIRRQIEMLDDDWKPPGDYGRVGNHFDLTDMPNLVSEIECWIISRRLRAQANAT